MRSKKKQATLPCTILTYVLEIELSAWEKNDVDSEFNGGFTKIYQGVTGPFASSLASCLKQFRGR